MLGILLLLPWFRQKRDVDLRPFTVVQDLVGGKIHLEQYDEPYLVIQNRKIYETDLAISCDISQCLSNQASPDDPDDMTP